MKCSLYVFANRFEKIYENSLNSVDIIVTFAIFSKSKKGDNSVEIHSRLSAFISNVALVMEYKCVKSDENSFNSMEVMAMSVFFKVLKVR